MNQSRFHSDELITKNGKQYPVVGARLRVAHEENDHISIKTEVVQFEPMDLAVVSVLISTTKGEFSGYGVASAGKDTRLVDSLLELAETRAIARGLRFAGYGVEYTGVEEIGDTPSPSQDIPQPQCQPHLVDHDFTPMTRSQRHAIESISTARQWDAIESARRILERSDIQTLDDISKKEAITVIGRFKDQMAA